MLPRFFNRYEQIHKTLNRLPHWEQPGVVCFLTFRLADSLPKNLMEAWTEEKAIWMKFHPEPWDLHTEMEYEERFGLQIDRWLDAGNGTCLLRNPINADAVKEALLFFDRDRYLMISFVVMPNHLHALLVLNQKWPLQKIVHSWKSWSSKRINELSEREGSVWQKDYYDCLIRDDSHFRKVVRYIRANPRRAELEEGKYLLWESDLATAVD